MKLPKDLTKDEREETTIVGMEFPEKRHTISELTKDEKISEKKIEKQFAKLAKESTKTHKKQEIKLGTKKRKIKINRTITPIIIMLIIISLIYFLGAFDNKVSITVIKNKECDFCTNVNPIIKSINESENIKIIEFEELDYREDKAKEIIEKIQIRTTPTIIIQGNVFTKTSFFKNLSSENIKKHGEKFVLSSFLPPLTEIMTNQILGIVNVIYLKDESCIECADLDHAIQKLKNAGVYVSNIKEVEINSEQGQKLKHKYNIKKVPILLFDQNLGLYQHISKQWNLYGSIEDDGIMIMRKTLPPYKNLETNKIKGIIKVTYLTDKTCTECYDPSIHKKAISRIMPYYKQEETIDISQIKAQELIVRYNINDVPTIILSKDINEYPLFETLFSNVYEKQTDESYVFKSNPKFKDHIYKDLKSNKIIKN